MADDLIPITPPDATPITPPEVSEEINLMDRSLAGLRDALEQLQAQEADVEAQEKERAKTPLALRLEVVSCEYMSVTFPPDKTIPVYHQGEVACPFGKLTPDQECRDCSHVRYIPYGSHLPTHEKRYQAHGMVIPVRDETQAEQIATLFDSMNLRPMRRIQYEIAHVKRLIAQAESRRHEAVARETERHQAGQARG